MVMSQCIRCRSDQDCHSYRCHYTNQQIKCQYHTVLFDTQKCCLCSSTNGGSHCSRNSDCANQHCSTGYTPVCSLSSHTCRCEATCSAHTDCAHLSCYTGDPVCSSAQNNSRTCICETSCSKHEECANHRCSYIYQPTCRSGRCACVHHCTSNTYCSRHLNCGGRGSPYCSTAKKICECEECIHDSDCSHHQCDTGYSSMCVNDTCVCQANPVDGGWSLWSSWTACSATCGLILQSRSRVCDNPPSSNGGHSCTGSAHQSKVCNIHHCPIDGGWSSWEAWTSCSATCGNGTQSRSRHCNNPTPSDGGKTCTGNTKEQKICHLDQCTGVVCPTCDQNLSCTWNNTCDATETCMIRSYQGFKLTVHCSKKDDCSFEKLALPTGEIFCCNTRECVRLYLGI
ncbi:hemicentin-1-like [Saccostrea echinata]|uniref:hemicentin-1-like n=1 Tax=Saccostrea echinata TaxID=191078 RepID=UPI002A7FA17E|nr:hemicentin-1-like [Saccostrea echinata]